MKTKSKSVECYFLGWMLLCCCVSLVHAGTTGKIAGKVIDKETGEVIVAVSVQLEKTSLGASSDIDGYYAILNISPGTYTVRFSCVGYRSQTVTNVLVRADLTTTLDAELVGEAILTQEVVVEAQRPMISKDETSKMNIVSSETFSNLPVIDVGQVVGLQAGFVTDANGELHARGGRSNEVMVLVDGIPTRDPIDGSMGTQVDKYSIQELQVLTGGFNAEYGQALSGVVNIVTKEGADKFHARFEYQSAQLNESPYHSKDALALDAYGRDASGSLAERTDPKGTTLSKDIPSAYKPMTLDQTPKLGPDINFQGTLWAILSGPMFFDNLRYYVSARFLNELSPLPWGYNKERELNSKLTYFSGNWKFNFTDRRTERLYKPYSHVWKYRPEGYEDRSDDSWRENMLVNYVPNAKTSIQLSLSYGKRAYEQYIPGRFAYFTPDGELDTTQHPPSNYLPRNNNIPPFWINADDDQYLHYNLYSAIGKLDVTSQTNRFNLVKAGIQANYYNIWYLTYQQPYTGGIHMYNNYNRFPVEFAAYVQDKLEFENFIMNVGLRFDYANVKDKHWSDVSVPAGALVGNKWVPMNEVSTAPRKQVSPRIGIAFPITDQTVFYSSYGHFFQMPDYLEMYQLRDPTVARALVGNPGIEPQKTVAFEFGVKQQLTTEFSIEVSAYFKDITNLVGSTYHMVYPFEYNIYDNSNYGEVKGVDITLNKRMSNYLSGSITYTYSVAKGNESDPNEGFNDYRAAAAILRPKRMFYLDFDRTHVLSSMINVNFPREFGPRIGNFFVFEQLNINFVVQAATGLPYTPDPQALGDMLVVEKNSGRLPGTFQADVRMERVFTVAGANLSLYLNVRNLFDNINALNVWSETGYPWDSGPITTRTEDRQHNPSNIDVRRTIQTGIRLDF